MSVVVDYEGDHVLICKGAVEDIYKACTHYQVDDEIHLMIDLIKSDLLEEYEELSRDGYRVLGIAYREFPRTKQVFSVADESDLILLGYIAFLDPPKGSAAKAIASLKLGRRGHQDPDRATTRWSPARSARTWISTRERSSRATS